MVNEDNMEDITADPPIDQHRKPKRGDTIQVVIDGCWRTVRISSNEHKTWENYYNFRMEDGSQNGMYLYMESLYWTFTLPNDTQEEAHEGKVEEETLHDAVQSTPNTLDDRIDDEMKELVTAEYLDDS